MISVDEAVRLLKSDVTHIITAERYAIAALLQQQQAESAAMRQALVDTMGRIEAMDIECWEYENGLKALNTTTAGAGMLAHVQRLEQQVRDMRLFMEAIAIMSDSPRVTRKIAEKLRQMRGEE